MLERGSKEPGCIGREGACPPEDCGGPHGYVELLAALAHTRHPEHEAMRAWVGSGCGASTKTPPRRVRDAVGVVPDSVRLLLDLLANGVELTPGGPRPHVVGRAVQEQRPHWYPLERTDVPCLAAT